MIDIGLLKQYNEAYRAGKPEISDAEYDAMVAQLRDEDPDNEFFKHSVIEEAKEERMETLPVPMFSLEKVKSIDELISWIKNFCHDPHDSFYLTITPKYDGISLLYDENTGAMWTRGNGIEGQRSDEWGKIMGIKKMPMNVDYCGSVLALNMPYTWGEAIISKENFKKIQKDTSYKTARNLVAGIFNSKKPNEFTKYVEFIRYGGDVQDSIMEVMKQMSFDMVNQNKDKVQEMEGTFDADARVFGWPITLYEINKHWINQKLHSLYEKWSENYNIDGIVIAIDFFGKEGIDLKERLANGNPKYKIAFKDPAWSGCADTEVEEITWKISKDGKSKPVINIKPVQIGGVTIKNVTGYNAKYMVDNHIAKGSEIRIIRSGDVIPKHIATLSHNEAEYERMMDDMMECPSCGGALVWDENMVELVCQKIDCKQKRVGKLVYAFATLGCEEFGEPTLTKLYDAGRCSLQSIFYMSEAELEEIEGIGPALAKVIYNQLAKLKTDGVPLARLMTAMNLFEGKIAEKTCQKILNNVVWEDVLHLVNDFEAEKLLHELCKIDGVSEITAQAFIEGVRTYLNGNYVPVKIAYIKEENNSFEGQMVVCMTGFRDAELTAKLIADGHRVVDGVTKETTHLIVKDKNSTSSKMKKAQKMGIKIVQRDEFVW
jgi:NAD-dependent DNA ligase